MTGVMRRRSGIRRVCRIVVGRTEDMRFPARDLKGFCDYLKPADLVIGRVYFRVQYVDDASLVPELLPRVFLGRNLFPKEEGGTSFLYFTEYYPSLPPDL